MILNRDIWSFILEYLDWPDIRTLECTSQFLQSSARKKFESIDLVLTKGVTIEHLMSEYEYDFGGISFQVDSDIVSIISGDVYRRWFIFINGDDIAYNCIQDAIQSIFNKFNPKSICFPDLPSLVGLLNFPNYIVTRYFQKLLDWNNADNLWSHLRLIKGLEMCGFTCSRYPTILYYILFFIPIEHNTTNMILNNDVLSVIVAYLDWRSVDALDRTSKYCRYVVSHRIAAADEAIAKVTRFVIDPKDLIKGNDKCIRVGDDIVTHFISGFYCINGELLSDLDNRKRINLYLKESIDKGFQIYYELWDFRRIITVFPDPQLIMKRYMVQQLQYFGGVNFWHNSKGLMKFTYWNEYRVFINDTRNIHDLLFNCDNTLTYSRKEILRWYDWYVLEIDENDEGGPSIEPIKGIWY